MKELLSVGLGFGSGWIDLSRGDSCLELLHLNQSQRF